MRVFKSVIILVMWGIQSASGQSISAVYSNNGRGLIKYQGLPHNLAMGEVGMATPSSWSLNFQNPAFLPFNRTTIFQVGVEYDRRTIESTEFSGQKNASGLRYLNFSFPIMSGKWTSSFGLNPYSTVSSKTFSEQTLDDGTVAITEFEGSGGLSSLHWSNGFRLSQNIYVGVRANYLFGSIEDSEQSTLTDSQGSFTTTFIDQSTYSGFTFEVAGGYRLRLDQDRALNFGLVYDISQKLTGTQKQIFGGEDRAEEDIVFNMPSSIGLGASYQIFNKLTLATDLTYTPWSGSGSGNDDFLNTTKLGVGAQWTPDYSSVNSYLSRVTYRFGVNVGSLPYEVSDQRIREFGINFGGSFPVGLSSLIGGL